MEHPRVVWRRIYISIYTPPDDSQGYQYNAPENRRGVRQHTLLR
jgi:hypothetical protein